MPRILSSTIHPAVDWWRSTRGAVVVACALAAAGCVGKVGEGHALPRDQVGGATPGGTTGGTGAACTNSGAPASPLRRLTHADYNNTVRDLLGDASNPADNFPDETVGEGFSNSAVALSVTPVLAEGYLDSAQKIAATAVKNLPALLQCDVAQAGEEACVRSFVERFGKRAFRRPVLPAEADRLVALFRSVRQVPTEFSASIETLLASMLQLPQFLYRMETGSPQAEPGRVPLTQYEIATRLSYLLWSTMPDDELFAAADSGQLATSAQIEQQARRLLASPRARAGVTSFYLEWLKLRGLAEASKDAAIYPEYSDKLKGAMAAETLAFVNNVLFESDGKLETLFTAPFTFVNGDLAKFYGLPGITGTELQRVVLDPSRGSGVITQGSLMAILASSTQSDPIARGKFVRQNLLCQSLPVPPNDIPLVQDPLPNTTTRQRFEQHRNSASCAACHELLDPVGFGFENFDGIGRYRTMDGALPVDNTGQITATRDMDGTFHGVPELARKLMDSTEAQECVTHSWFTYAYGRPPAEDDACTLEEAHQAFVAKGLDLRELPVALTRGDSFVYRRKELP
jgi:Protein of unknown function (DUF1592)/Protein of unknown function (DUF1588)/Protein of unknown function (DUF1587)/Protein of unknown function (DUF1595)/Protein of unknown function (DUF1585)